MFLEFNITTVTNSCMIRTNVAPPSQKMVPFAPAARSRRNRSRFSSSGSSIDSDQIDQPVLGPVQLLVVLDRAAHNSVASACLTLGQSPSGQLCNASRHHLAPGSSHGPHYTWSWSLPPPRPSWRWPSPPVQTPLWDWLQIRTDLHLVFHLEGNTSAFRKGKLWTSAIASWIRVSLASVWRKWVSSSWQMPSLAEVS